MCTCSIRGTGAPVTPLSLHQPAVRRTRPAEEGLDAFSENPQKKKGRHLANDVPALRRFTGDGAQIPPPSELMPPKTLLASVISVELPLYNTPLTACWLAARKSW